jgi:rhodanese-related sulfurtransferase
MATDNQVYTKISAAEAKEKIDAGAAVVDTRPPADWAGGHVPGAQNLPLVSIRGRAREIPEGAEVIFVCQDGERSPQAAETAHGLGFEKVYVLDGGVNAWVKAGNGLETIN